MQTVRLGAEQFRRELANLLSRVSVSGDQIIVERHGSPQAVLISYTLFEQLAEPIQQRANLQMTEDEFIRLMIEQGIVLPRETTSPSLSIDDWKPVPIQGKPVS
jgi:prevent-host-death family protein